MGLDVARALALLGMIGAHVGTTEELVLLDPTTWGALVHGRSSILFAVLAGVSIALMTGRDTVPTPERMPQIRLSLLGRGAAIFIIGLLLEMLNTPIAVILTVYGILYLIAIPFLRWSPQWLLIAAAVLAVAGPPLLSLVQSLLLMPMGPGLDLVLFGTYPVTVWMAFIFAGMALGRLRPERIRTAVVCLIVGVVLSIVGYGIGALAGGTSESDDSFSSSSSSSTSYSDDGVYGVAPDEIDLTGALCDKYSDGYISCYPKVDSTAEDLDDTGYDTMGGWESYAESLESMPPLESMLTALTTAEAHSGGTAEILGSGGFALVIIALCLLLSRPVRWLLLPFAALGSMPLTAYSAHIVALFVLAGPGGFLSGNDTWLVMSVALMASCTLWALFFGRGPLERLVGRAARNMTRVHHDGS
ncbi:MAG TPA: hypothetical protein DIW46_13205 [Microbacterium sp.]|nr:hypothetical protein [Microbacterium sp.]